MVFSSIPTPCDMVTCAATRIRDALTQRHLTVGAPSSPAQQRVGMIPESFMVATASRLQRPLALPETLCAPPSLLGPRRQQPMPLPINPNGIPPPPSTREPRPEVTATTVHRFSRPGTGHGLQRPGGQSITYPPFVGASLAQATSAPQPGLLGAGAGPRRALNPTRPGGPRGTATNPPCQICAIGETRLLYY